MSMFHGHLVAVRVLLDVQFWSSVVGPDAATVVDVAVDWSVHRKCRDDGRYAIRCTRLMAVKVI